MKNKTLSVLIIGVLFFAGTTSAQNQVTHSVFGSGGTKVSSASYILNSTIGESFIGKSTTTLYQKQSGFWYVYLQDIITAVEDEETIPTTFRLEQNYPNPFNPSTRIKYQVPSITHVTLKVYDILGSEVVTLVNKEMDAGRYDVEFNAGGYSSGVFLLRMEAGSYVNTKKMILLR